MTHTERTKLNHPFVFVRKTLEGEDPFKWLNKLVKSVQDCDRYLFKVYESIEDQIALGDDPMAWREVRSDLDDKLEAMPAEMYEKIQDILKLMWDIKLIGEWRK